MPLPPDTTMSDAHLASNLAVALLPHCEAALLGMRCDVSLAADAAATLASLRAALPPKKRYVAETPEAGPAAKRGAGAAAAAAPVVASMRRVITSVTYVRRLHVGADLAALLPDMSAHVPKTTMRSADNTVFFKTPVTLVDGTGARHVVSYDGGVSSGQRHTRLSAGWSAVIRALGVKVGDAVIFELRGDRAQGELHVRKEAAGKAVSPHQTKKQKK